MLSRSQQEFLEDLGLRSQRIGRRTIFIVASLFVSLSEPIQGFSSPADVVTVELSKDTKKTSESSAEWIDDFQRETQISHESIKLLLELFGEEELQNPNSPLRMKLSIISETLQEHYQDPLTISKILDTMIDQFSTDYEDAIQAGQYDDKKKLIIQLDFWVPEFIIDFFDDPERILAIHGKVTIEAAKRGEARRLIELVREDREKALIDGKITVAQQYALEEYYKRDSYLDKFEPLPWVKGNWEDWNDRLKTQYFISDKEVPYNALVAELLHRVCEKLHPLPDGEKERIACLWGMTNDYPTTMELINYAKSVLKHIDGENTVVENTNVLSEADHPSSELPELSNDNIFAVLGSLDNVARQMSEQQKKPIKPYVFEASDNTKMIDAHFADRPVMQLYLKYISAISEFPDQEIVAVLRKKKNLDEDMPDTKVISSWDIVPMSTRNDMPINGNSRSDLELLQSMKYFNLQSFMNIFDGDKSIIDGYLVDIFKVMKRKFPREEKKLLKEKNVGADGSAIEHTLVAKDSKTIAAMLCYLVIHDKMPSYKEVNDLLSSIQGAQSELVELRGVDQEWYMMEQHKSRQNELSLLEVEHEKIIEAMADKVLIALQHPKGTAMTDKVLSDDFRHLKACGVNGRNSMKNILSLTHPDKKTEFVYNPNEFAGALDQGKFPIWKNAEAYGLYDFLPVWGQGHVVEAYKKEALYANIVAELNHLAIVHNSNVFELFFWTGKYPIGHPRAGKNKGHRTPVFLNPNGEWMALDPIKTLAKDAKSRRLPFPIGVFFDRMDATHYINPHKIDKKTGKHTYRCVIDVSSQYGYLHEETVASLAMVATNPDVMDYLEEKLGSDAVNYMPYIEKYELFTSPEVQDLVVPTLTVSSLEEIYFDSYENNYYQVIVDVVNNIKNTFDRRTIANHLLNNDIIGLQEFLFDKGDELEELIEGESHYSGVLDMETLSAIQALNEESYYYNRSFGDDGVGYVRH